jgi:hypothetical protein
VSYNLTNLTRENVLKTDLNGREKKYFINYEDLIDTNNQIQLRFGLVDQLLASEPFFP